MFDQQDLEHVADVIGRKGWATPSSPRIDRHPPSRSAEKAPNAYTASCAHRPLAPEGVAIRQRSEVTPDLGGSLVFLGDQRDNLGVDAVVS